MKIIRQFSTVADWIDAAQVEQDHLEPMAHRGSHTYQSIRWSGVAKRDDAFTLLRNGYPEGTNQMQEILAAIKSTIKLPTIEQYIESDIEGSCPNVEAFVQGLPEDMFAFKEIERDQTPTFINVQLEACVSAFVQPFQMQMVGAALYAAMESLKAQGIAIQYTLTHTVATSYSRKEIWQSQVPISANLDLDSTSYLLTHPSVLRTIVFSLMEHEDESTRNLFGFQTGKGRRTGYGSPCDVRMPEANVFLTMNRLTQLITSPAQAIAQATKLAQDLVDSKFECYAMAEDFMPWED